MIPTRPSICAQGRLPFTPPETRLDELMERSKRAAYTFRYPVQAKWNLLLDRTGTRMEC
jgi:hypothetical protein